MILYYFSLEAIISLTEKPKNLHVKAKASTLGEK